MDGSINIPLGTLIISKGRKIDTPVKEAFKKTI